MLFIGSMWILIGLVFISRCLAGDQSSLFQQKLDTSSSANTTELDRILHQQCCNNPFIFVKRYEKGFFNQINAYLSVSQIAIYASLTHITPDIVSNYLESNLGSKSKPCWDSYSNDAIRAVRNRNCALDVPFEEVVDLAAWQEGLVERQQTTHNNDLESQTRQPIPPHCLLSISQAQRLCQLSNLRSLPPSAMYPPSKYFFNATTFLDPQQTQALHHWVSSRSQHMLYLHGRFARRVVIQLDYDAFRAYRSMRLREVAFLQPGPLLQSYVLEALGHELLRGGFNALHLRLEKDMLASFMVDGWIDKLNLDHVISFLNTYLPPISPTTAHGQGDPLPLYVAYAGELPMAYRQALQSAGYKVVTKSDIWKGASGSHYKGVMSIQSREILGFFEFQMFLHASVFVGMSRSSLSLYAFERRAMTYSPSLDFLTSPEVCCMAGRISYEHILTLNAGQTQLDRRYRLAFVTAANELSREDWTLNHAGDFFWAALFRAVRRLGHYAHEIPWGANNVSAVIQPTLSQGENDQVDMYVLVWKLGQSNLLMPSYVSHTAGAKVVLYVDWSDDGMRDNWEGYMVSILKHCHAVVFPSQWVKDRWLVHWKDEVLPLTTLLVIGKGVEPAYHFPTPTRHSLSQYHNSSLSPRSPYRVCSVLPQRWNDDDLQHGVQTFGKIWAAANCGQFDFKLALPMPMHHDFLSNLTYSINLHGTYVCNASQMGMFWRSCDVFVLWPDWGASSNEWSEYHVLSALATGIPVVAPDMALYKKLIKGNGEFYAFGVGFEEAIVHKGLGDVVCKVLSRYGDDSKLSSSYDIDDIAEEYIRLLRL